MTTPGYRPPTYQPTPAETYALLDQLRSDLTTMIANATGAGVAPSVIVPPAALVNPALTAWQTANKAMMDRFTLPMATPIRYLNWAVGVASGNVQVGIVKLSGTGRLSYSAPVVATAVMACPAAGNIRTDLGLTTLPGGDYAAFLWADNTTMTARWAANANPGVQRMCLSASGLTSGVVAAGTAVVENAGVSLSLEGDF